MFSALALLGGDAVLVWWADNVIKGIDGAAYVVAEAAIVKKCAVGGVGAFEEFLPGRNELVCFAEPFGVFGLEVVAGMEIISSG